MGPRAWLPALLLLALLATAGQAGQGGDDAGERAAGATDEIDWADCLACHDIGGEELPRLSDLRVSGFGAKIRRDCLECHDRVDLTTISDIWLHDTRAPAAHVDCLVCHTAAPHGVDDPPQPARWGASAEERCFECHRTVELDLAQQYSHGFSPGVRCRDCHEPHAPFAAAVPESLLSDDLAELRGAGYDWRESSRACLNCHGEAQLTLGLTEGFVTLNTVNYHDLHLQSGRTMCIECHDPHGSQRRGMIRRTLLTGEVLHYIEEPDGGTCAVRCHGVEHDGWTYRNEVY